MGNLTIIDNDTQQNLEAVALQMSKTKLTVPAHLQGNPGACFTVCRNALTWGMDPWLLGQETSDIKGKIMYSGKAVNAAIQQDHRLEFPLDYEFEGQGDNMVCIVIGKLRGENKERRVRVPMPPANKRVSDHWKTNPEQQLSYYSARVWARRHLPGMLLGVYTPEDPQMQNGMHRPQRENADVVDNIVRAANGEDPIQEQPAADDDFIDGDFEHVENEPAADDVVIRLIKSDGNDIVFNSFQEWIDCIEKNLGKMKEIDQLFAFEERHADLFEKYRQADFIEWVDMAIDAIIRNKERLSNDEQL